MVIIVQFVYKYYQSLVIDRSMDQKRIAIIGGGIAGMATAWLLRSHAQVTLFEREPTLGGHAHTVQIADPQGPVSIDTGFVVYNEHNYPLLTQLLRDLQVDTQPTAMSFAFSEQPQGIEYAGTSLSTLFAQPGNLLRPRFLRMVLEILRFNRLALRLLAEDRVPDATLGDFLQRERFGAGLTEDYLLPMAAAIWSCPLQEIRAFPLRSFLEFFQNHGLLHLLDRPQWRTVVGGSRSYVDRLAAALPEGSVHFAAVAKLQRTAEGRWEVRTCPATQPLGGRSRDRVHVLSPARQASPDTAAATAQAFDAIVFACHADQALALLDGQASSQVRTLLRSCRFQSNRALLHTDTRLLPRSRKVWASWNYLSQADRRQMAQVSVSYYMNELHHLDRRTHYIISLNPWLEPHPTTVLGEYHWEHPVFDAPALSAKQSLGALQGQDGLYFSGAWCGYGFHEDGLRSAVEVAQHLRVPIPWTTTTRTASPPPSAGSQPAATRVDG